MEECSAKYNAAKKADTLKGMSWTDFRKAECGTEAAPVADLARRLQQADRGNDALVQARKAIESNMVMGW